MPLEIFTLAKLLAQIPRAFLNRSTDVDQMPPEIFILVKLLDQIRRAFLLLVLWAPMHVLLLIVIFFVYGLRFSRLLVLVTTAPGQLTAVSRLNAYLVILPPTLGPQTQVFQAGVCVPVLGVATE